MKRASSTRIQRRLLKLTFYRVESFLTVYNNLAINEWACNRCLTSYKVSINLGAVFRARFWGSSRLSDEILRRIISTNLGNDWRRDKIDKISSLIKLYPARFFYDGNNVVKTCEHLRGRSNLL